MAESITIVGAGGLAREVFAALEASGERVGGFIVERGHALGQVAGLLVRDDPESWAAGGLFVIAIGNGLARKRIVDRLTAGPVRASFAYVRHPAALIGPRVTIGTGTLILGPLSVTTDVEIGEHVVINPGCTIAHDCRIGSFVNLGPQVALAGGVVVEE